MIDILFQGFVMIGLACIGYMFGLATNRRDALKEYKKGYNDGKRDQRVIERMRRGQCSCTTMKSVSEERSQSSSTP